VNLLEQEAVEHSGALKTFCAVIELYLLFPCGRGKASFLFFMFIWNQLILQTGSTLCDL